MVGRSSFRPGKSSCGGHLAGRRKKATGDGDSVAKARTVHSPDGSADRLTAEVSAYSIRAARHATPIAPPAARRPLAVPPSAGTSAATSSAPARTRPYSPGDRQATTGSSAADSPDAASRREPTGLMVPGSAEYEYLVTYE